MRVHEPPLRTVLIAKPMDDSHDFYVSWFARQGFEVLGTSRADIALAMIDECPPDLLVVDFGLTGVDTAQVISRLRRSAVGERIDFSNSYHLWRDGDPMRYADHLKQ